MKLKRLWPNVPKRTQIVHKLHSYTLPHSTLLPLCSNSAYKHTHSTQGSRVTHIWQSSVQEESIIMLFKFSSWMHAMPEGKFQNTDREHLVVVPLWWKHTIFNILTARLCQYSIGCEHLNTKSHTEVGICRRPATIDIHHINTTECEYTIIKNL